MTARKWGREPLPVRISWKGAIFFVISGTCAGQNRQGRHFFWDEWFCDCRWMSVLFSVGCLEHVGSVWIEKVQINRGILRALRVPLTFLSWTLPLISRRKAITLTRSLEHSTRHFSCRDYCSRIRVSQRRGEAITGWHDGNRKKTLLSTRTAHGNWNLDTDEIPFTTVRLIKPIVIDALNEPSIRTS